MTLWLPQYIVFWSLLPVTQYPTLPRPNCQVLTPLRLRCLTCRKRKTRCAGERPVCSTCTKNGHQCLGYPEEIKREDCEKPSPLDKQAHERDEHEPRHYHDENIKIEKASVSAQHAPETPNSHAAAGTTMSLANMIDPKVEDRETPSATAQNGHHPSTLPTSPTAVRRSESHRVPYFRYFGPTAI